MTETEKRLWPASWSTFWQGVLHVAIATAVGSVVILAFGFVLIAIFTAEPDVLGTVLMGVPCAEVAFVVVALMAAFFAGGSRGTMTAIWLSTMLGVLASALALPVLLFSRAPAGFTSGSAAVAGVGVGVALLLFHFLRREVAAAHLLFVMLLALLLLGLTTVVTLAMATHSAQRLSMHVLGCDATSFLGTVHVLVGFPLTVAVAAWILTRIAERPRSAPVPSDRVMIFLIVAVIGVGALAAVLLDNAKPGHPSPIHCRSNLRQIGLAIQMYRNDFNDYFPPSFGTLYPQYVSSRMVFVCSEDMQKQGHVETATVRGLPVGPESGSYAYVRPRHPFGKIPDPSTAVVAFDRRGNHADGCNVLYADGHIEFRPNFVYRPRSALHTAVLQGDAAEVRRLIAAGANINALDANGITPLDAARAEGHDEIVNLLEAARRTDGGKPANKTD